MRDDDVDDNDDDGDDNDDDFDDSGDNYGYGGEDYDGDVDGLNDQFLLSLSSPFSSSSSPPSLSSSISSPFVQVCRARSKGSSFVWAARS